MTLLILIPFAACMLTVFCPFLIAAWTLFFPMHLKEPEELAGKASRPCPPALPDKTEDALAKTSSGPERIDPIRNTPGRELTGTIRLLYEVLQEANSPVQDYAVRTLRRLGWHSPHVFSEPEA